MFSIVMYVAVFIVGGVLISIYSYFRRLKFIKNNILKNWGKELKGKYTIDDMDNISSYFKNNKDQYESYIDDITWNDLNMDDIFKRINNTQSSAGEEVLYNILREPLHNEAELKERDDLITYFQKNSEKRQEIQYNIAKLDKIRDVCVSNYFYDKKEYSNKDLIKYRVLGIMPILTLVLCFFDKVAIVFFIASISINMYLHYSLEKKNKTEFQGFMYIVGLVNCANKICKCDMGILKDSIDKVKDSVNNVKSVKGNSFSVFSGGGGSDAMIMLEYVKTIFLSSVISFEKMSCMLVKNREDFKKIYEFVGTVDSIIGITSYRESLEYYIKPVLHKSNFKESHLEFKDMYHPLIKEPVVNSCSVDKPILITGSNASGKSTFLKTVAINAIMAQTIYTCCAKQYESSYFNVYSSMALRDSIFNNESYYIVEIKSLKRIIDSLNDKIPCLCFVDEILRGTNTVERISSSAEVLNYFGNSNCICMAATHDVELTHILDKIFDNYHFQEDVVDNNITFDYKLYNGRAETRNAIKLLKFMGYNENIVESAESRAEEFLNTGIWSKVK